MRWSSWGLTNFSIFTANVARGIDYSFLFMKASGEQLGEFSKLIEAGVIQPVIDRTFTFDQTPAAMASRSASVGRSSCRTVSRTMSW